MEIENYLAQLKDFQKTFINYIEEEEDDFNTLLDFFNESKIPKNKDEFIDIFNFILIIVDNHYHNDSFYSKICKILLHFQKDFQATFSNMEMFDLFKKNKPILLFLIENKFIELDKTIMNIILTKNDKNSMKLIYCLFKYVKPHLNKKKKQKIENEMYQQSFGMSINEFEENCKIGKNHFYICELIRKDKVEDFIIYMNKNNVAVDSRIQPSIFESNPFLIDKSPTLIEYATFYGSIEIFQYLRLNNANLYSSLWIYAIHGKNAELIHLLEENHIVPNDKTYNEVLEESIKCHHNDIANYIIDNLISNGTELNMSTVYQYYNFAFLPTDFNSIISQPKIVNGFNIFNAILAMQKITIPESITQISPSSFKNCTQLQEVSFPSSLLTIGDFAFQGCSSLIKINFNPDSSLNTIGAFSFNECSISELKIPSNVTVIGPSAFKGCSLLQTVTISSSVTSIGSSAFQRCSSLQTVLFDDNSKLKSIGSYAFHGCSSLANISIPSSVTSMGENFLPNRLIMHKPNLLFE